MTTDAHEVIEPNAIIQSEAIRPDTWNKVRQIVNATFLHLHQFASAQGLDEIHPFLRGPHHFRLTLDNENGLVVIFSPRRRGEPQRVYADDLRRSGDFVSIEGSLRFLKEEKTMPDARVIHFWPNEYRNALSQPSIPKLKAAEFLSALVFSDPPSATAQPPVPPVDPELLFVLMPFTEPWSKRIWDKHLRPIITSVGMNPKRADDLYGAHVLRDIWTSIRRARIILADVTGRNANVYYELGIAHALRKPTVIITQSGNDIPFDLRPFRHVIYEDNSDGYENLKAFLPQMIKNALESDGFVPDWM